MNKANSILGIIKRNFKYLSFEAFVSVYKAMVRPHLEYAVQLWSPYRKSYIEDIEKVQIRATKLIPGMRNVAYEERLRKLKLPTLKYRRLRGDIIEMFKIARGLYSVGTTVHLEFASYVSTRGNCYKLLTQRTVYDLRKYFFVNRIEGLWNSLPNHVVTSPNLNIFKNRLDAFISNQEIMYDWKSEISGTGNRSFE